MARGPRRPKLSCRLVSRPDRCGEQKLAQAYRALVPESAGAPGALKRRWKGVEYETNGCHLR